MINSLITARFFKIKIMSFNKSKEYREKLRTFYVLLTFATIGFISTISVVIYLVYKLFKYIF